jgi:hypothetical protein
LMITASMSGYLANASSILLGSAARFFTSICDFVRQSYVIEVLHIPGGSPTLVAQPSEHPVVLSDDPR